MAVLKTNRNQKKAQHMIQLLYRRKEKIALQKNGLSLTLCKDLMTAQSTFLILTQACAKGQEMYRG